MYYGYKIQTNLFPKQDGGLLNDIVVDKMITIYNIIHN